MIAMSFVDFNKVFFPTEEEIKAQEKLFKDLHDLLVEDRKNVKLVPDGDGLLYRREPFGGFLGDCDLCSHCFGNDQGISEGGWCDLHGVGCGYGFTCKDNDGEWAIGKEFYERYKRN